MDGDGIGMRYGGEGGGRARCERVRRVRDVPMEAKLICMCVGSGGVAREHTGKAAARASGR